VSGGFIWYSQGLEPKAGQGAGSAQGGAGDSYEVEEANWKEDWSSQQHTRAPHAPLEKLTLRSHASSQPVLTREVGGTELIQQEQHAEHQGSVSVG